MLDYNDDLMLTTKNRITGDIGCAVFQQNGKIGVFEGNEDGSDDKAVSYDTFINNYSYKVCTSKGIPLKDLEVLNYDNLYVLSEENKADAEIIANKISNILNSQHKDYVNFDYVHKIASHYIDDKNKIDDICYEAINILNNKYNIEYENDFNI